MIQNKIKRRCTSLLLMLAMIASIFSNIGIVKAISNEYLNVTETIASTLNKDKFNTGNVYNLSLQLTLPDSIANPILKIETPYGIEFNSYPNANTETLQPLLGTDGVSLTKTENKNNLLTYNFKSNQSVTISIELKVTHKVKNGEQSTSIKLYDGETLKERSEERRVGKECYD